MDNVKPPELVLPPASPALRGVHTSSSQWPPFQDPRCTGSPLSPLQFSLAKVSPNRSFPALGSSWMHCSGCFGRGWCRAREKTNDLEPFGYSLSVQEPMRSSC